MMWFRGLALLLVVWGAKGLIAESLRVDQHHDWMPALPAGAWRLAGPQQERLEAVLAQVKARVPAGGLVWVETDSGSDGDLFFVHAWVAYGMPNHRVARYKFRPPRQRGGYRLRLVLSRLSSPEHLVSPSGIEGRTADDGLMPDGEPLWSSQAATLWRLR